MIQGHILIIMMIDSILYVYLSMYVCKCICVCVYVCMFVHMNDVRSEWQKPGLFILLP